MLTTASFLIVDHLPVLARVGLLPPTEVALRNASLLTDKEVPMSVKVLITRTVPLEKGREMLQLFREMRNLATSQAGYISGETLKSNDRPDVFLVISTWESAADWEAWLLSKERQAIQEKIDALLGGKTHYELFHYRLRE